MGEDFSKHLFASTELYMAIFESLRAYATVCERSDRAADLESYLKVSMRCCVVRKRIPGR